MAQPSPIHSWKSMGPWVVSAVKSGASELILSVIAVVLWLGRAPSRAVMRPRSNRVPAPPRPARRGENADRLAGSGRG